MTQSLTTKRLPGAQPANRNSVRHGLRMALPRLPKGCRHIQRQADNLRLALERALESRAQTIGPFEAACIAAVAKWHRHGALAARWLRLREQELSDAGRLRYSQAVAYAANEVVRLLGALGLDALPKPVTLAAYLAKPQEVPADGA